MKKIHFDNPDEFKRLERDAYYGVLDISRFPMAEYKYFNILIELGYQHRHENLPKELVQEYKSEAYREYLKNSEIINARLRYAKLCNEKILVENSARAKINKAKTMKEMLTIALYYIEKATGEQGFAERNLRKLKSKGAKSIEEKIK